MARIRNMELNDVKKVYKCASDTPLPKERSPSLPLPEEQLRQMIQSEQGALLIAVERNKVVGFVISRLDDAGRAEIEHLYVDPAYGGRGITQELYKKCEAQLKEKGATSITNLVK